MKKRWMMCAAALLCAVVLLLAMPIAAEETSGNCGENLTWVLKDGVLTISGEGEMTSNPWIEWKDEITEVVIEEGITTVCDSAFEGCSNLQYVTVEGTVTSVGELAFYTGNRHLAMFFHGDAPKLGSQWKYEYVTLWYPEDNATWDPLVEQYAWSMVQLRPACYDTSGACGENMTYSFEDGVLTFSGSGKMYDYTTQNMPPWQVFSRKTTKVVIEEGITHIGYKAFAEFSYLTEVVVPKTVTELEGQAFVNCTKLQAIELPGVTVIGDWAFSECTALENVTLGDDLVLIWEYAFRGCTSLKSIVIPPNVVEMETAFYGCTSLEAIYFTGDPPCFFEDYFRGTTTTAYYPADNPAWTEDVLQDYGGNITWVPYDPASLPSGDAKLGDVNGDGYVDSDDAALILKYDVGLIDGLDEALGDVNGDGYVDSDDAALILKYDVGLIEGF